MIEVLDDELSLENGFKSSLSKIKKHKHRHSHSRSTSSSIKKTQLENNVVDLGDLGSPTSSRSIDLRSSTSSSSIATAAPPSGTVDMSRQSMEAASTYNNSQDTNDQDEGESSERLFDAEEFAEKMKTAAILLAQLQLEHPQQDNTTIRASTEGIRQKIIAEMMALEDDRMIKMAMEGVDSGVGGGGGEGAGNEKKLDDETRVAMVVNKEDPSGKYENYLHDCICDTKLNYIHK
jgi:hypothetical protein